MRKTGFGRGRKPTQKERARDAEHVVADRDYVIGAEVYRSSCVSSEVSTTSR